MPESLYAAAGKVAEIAGVGTYAGTQVYRALQASDALPVSAGRRVWLATPGLVASYVIGLACDEEMACFLPVAACRQGIGLSGGRTLQNWIAGLLASPGRSAEVDRIEIRRDDATATIVMRNGDRVEFDASPDHQPPAVGETWMRKPVVIPGAMLVAIAESIDFDREPGPRSTAEGEA